MGKKICGRNLYQIKPKFLNATSLINFSSIKYVSVIPSPQRYTKHTKHLPKYLPIVNASSLYIKYVVICISIIPQKRYFKSILKTCHYCICCSVIKLCPTLPWPHELYPARLHCPWDFSGKNTEVSCHFLLWESFLTQGSNLSLLHWQADSLLLSHQGSPLFQLLPLNVLFWFIYLFFFTSQNSKIQDNSLANNVQTLPFTGRLFQFVCKEKIEEEKKNN